MLNSPLISCNCNGLTSTTTVKHINVLQVFGGESHSLSQVIETNAGVQWDDGWLFVSGEGVRIIVHDGEIVITDSICGCHGCAHFIKLIT